MFDQRRISQRTGLHADGFASTAVKLFQSVEFLFADGAIEAEPDRLRDGRSRAAIDGETAGDFFDRPETSWPEPRKGLRPFDGRQCFRQLDTPCQIEVQVRMVHVPRSVQACHRFLQTCPLKGLSSQRYALRALPKSLFRKRPWTAVLSFQFPNWARTGDHPMAPENPNRDPRVYLAAERTFLAWIRTGLSLMAFGFVIARFGLFLRALEASRGGSPVESLALSMPLGVAFVLTGVLVNVFSAWQHVRYIHGLNRDSLPVGRPSRLAIALALVVAVAGLVMACYLGTAHSGNLGPAAPSTQPLPSRLAIERLRTVCRCQHE
jgi:putative membrane protein